MTNARFSNKKLRPPGICSGATWAGDCFLHRDCRFVQIGFYLHRVRRPPARSGDGKNLDGCDSARVFGTQRSRIRGDWILSTQRLPIHWSLRDSRGDDIAFVSSQMQAKFRRRFRVVFS